MQNQPLVSVIIPAYNASLYISEAIQSVLEQDYKNIEIIVINDGSTDDTSSILEEFNNNIIIINQENSGAAVARNKGLRAARGEYIAFLDADDVWLPGKLYTQVKYLEDHPDVGMVYCSWSEWYPDDNGKYSLPDNSLYQNLDSGVDKEHSGWLYTKLLREPILNTDAVMIRTSIVKEVGFFDETLLRGQDYDYWLRLSRLTQIHKLKAILCLYRIHSKSISNKPHPHNYGYYVLKQNLDRWGNIGPDGTTVSKKDIEEVLANISFRFGYMHYLNGDPWLAHKAFRTSIMHQPFRIKSWVYLLLSIIKSTMNPLK